MTKTVGCVGGKSRVIKYKTAAASLGAHAGGEQDLREGLLHVPDGGGEAGGVRLRGVLLTPRNSQRSLRRPAGAAQGNHIWPKTKTTVDMVFVKMTKIMTSPVSC